MITYRHSKTLIDCYRTYQLVSSLDVYYPDFNDWYWNKVVPATVHGDDGMVLCEEHDKIIGACLFKRGTEPKLRCLRVDPSYANRGIGIHLIDKSLRVIDHAFPEVTIPEETIHDLSRVVVNRFDFKLDNVEKGVYRPGKLEYQFNMVGPLKHKSPYTG